MSSSPILDANKAKLRTALSGGHRKNSVDPKKVTGNELYNISYSRHVYQHGEYENDLAPKLFSELTESTLGRIIHVESIAQACFMVLFESGKVYTFGKDRYGGLAHGAGVKQQAHPRMVEALEHIPVSKIFSGFGKGAAVTDSGKLYVWGNGVFAPVLTELPNAFLRVVQVALGSNHVAVRVQSGDLYTWGSNSNGELGLGTNSDTVAHPSKVNIPPLSDIKASYVHSLALTTKKELYVWGRNILKLDEEVVPILYEGQPEHIRAPFKVPFAGSGNIAEIACGNEFNVVLTEDGKVWTWGRARCGCLGNGSEEANRAVPTIVKALENIKMEHISCGLRHTAAWNSSGAIYTWGYGEKGNLGHGNTDNQLIPKILVGLPFTHSNTPSDGVKKVVCCLSQTFIIWERLSLVEQALRYLNANSLNEEGIFRISPSVSDVAEIQSKVESGVFAEFPSNSHHLAAGVLMRQLRHLLPHSIIELMVELDGTVDKPLRDLRVMNALCDSIENSAARPIMAQFTRLLVEISLHPKAKMPLRNLAICVGACFFVNGTESQAGDMNALMRAQKEQTVIQDVVCLLLQNAPAFFDYMLSGLLHLCNYVEFQDAPKLLEALTNQNFDAKTREKVTACLDFNWATFEPLSVYSKTQSITRPRHTEEPYVVPLVGGIPVVRRRSTIGKIMERLTQMENEFKTASLRAEKTCGTITALQRSIEGLETLLEAMAKQSPKITVNDAHLMDLLTTRVTTSEAATRKPDEELYYVGGGGEDITLRHHNGTLLAAKQRLERELLQVMRDLQSLETQVTAQHRKGTEAAVLNLQNIRQSTQNTLKLVLQKGASFFVEVLEQSTLPQFYIKCEPAPTIRGQSTICEVLVNLLYLVKYEWETSVFNLHSEASQTEAWAKVTEVYTWWKSLCTLYNSMEGVSFLLSSGIEACKGHISPAVIEKQETTMKHVRNIFEEISRYIKTTLQANDHLQATLEQKRSVRASMSLNSPVM